MIDLEALRAPFAFNAHSWRAQQVARDGRRAQALCYITSRAVQNRLDEVCGPAGWQSRFEETASGRVIATIEIDLDGRWVAKSDGAGATAMEGEKGGLSDAFKRAAVMWGIGRYLYGMPAVWAECEVQRENNGDMRLRNGKPQWKRWTPEGINQLEAALRKLFTPDSVQEPARVAGRRAQRLLPPPDTAPMSLGLAPAFRQPEVVRELLDGLPAAIREGKAEAFWSAHYRSVPEIWRPFVVDQRDRLKREAGL